MVLRIFKASICLHWTAWGTCTSCGHGVLVHVVYFLNREKSDDKSLTAQLYIAVITIDAVRH